MAGGGQVRAAGGVVVREGRVCAIHRPLYEDWSLPKGKLEPDESFQDAAVREVREETSLGCALEAELSPHAYVDRKGRPKLVRWWRMRVVDPAPFTVNHEVDELRWLSPEEAERVLTYEHDRELVREALAGA